MEQHIKVIGILDIILGVVAILTGLFIILAFALGGVFVRGLDGGPALAAILSGLGLFIGALVIAVGIFQIVVGVRIQAFRPWTRVAQIILGILALPGFPVGTAFGVYVLWAMLNRDIAELFERTENEHKRAA